MKKGFDYFIDKEILADYQKKPLNLRLQWLYYANKLRKSLPKKIQKIQDKFRKAEI